MNNTLEKKRINFYITTHAREIIEEIAFNLGLSKSGVIELIVRDYKKNNPDD